jgi:hypothetical protein
MTARGVLPQHFARASDLETFRNRFSGFAARNGLRHKARKIDEILGVTTAFPVVVALLAAPQAREGGWATRRSYIGACALRFA